MSKSKRLGLSQSATRVAEIRSLGFVVMSLQLTKYIAFVAHVRFKIFNLFSFEHVGSNMEV